MSAKKIKLVYAGLRVDGDKVLQCFVDEEKHAEERLFSGVKFVLIGHVYAAERNGENVTIKRRPEYLGEADEVSEKEIEEWEARTLAAEAWRKRKREAARAKGFERKIESAIKPLREAMKNMSFGERRAFAELVASRLSRPGKGDRMSF